MGRQQRYFGPGLTIAYFATLFKYCYHLYETEHESLGAKFEFSSKDFFDVFDAKQQRQNLYMLSMIADVYILLHHYSNPVHPKFRFSMRRTLVMATHILSGTTEIFAGSVAIFKNEPTQVARVAAVAGIIHVFSAIDMIPITFGTPAIMFPAYFLTAILHLHTAVLSLLDPSNHEKTLSMIIMVETFVWVRVFIFMFAKVPGVRKNRYTTGVLFAGLLTIPAVYGVAGNLMAVLGIALFANMHKPEHIGKERDYGAIRGTAKEIQSWHKDIKIFSILVSDKPRFQASRELAKLLDDGDDNRISKEELAPLAKTVGIDVNKMFPAGAESLTCDHCANALSELLSSKEVKSLRKRLAEDRTVAQKIAFDMLDANGDGGISYDEIHTLFIMWGLTEGDVDHFFKQLDKDDDARVDFDEFRTVPAGILILTYLEELLLDSSTSELGLDFKST